MPKLALLFPGQGVQRVGMGVDLTTAYPAAYSLLQQADAALGWSLSNLIANGPATELNVTPYTQPAILTTSLAYWQAWQEAGVRAEAAIGLSLGEYSALAAAGALDFATAVRLVHERGKAMDAAYPADAGAVAVVLGLERDMVQAICEEESRTDSFVQASNFNCPGQIVIAGDKAAVEHASDALITAGAKRIIPLAVSAPFHTRLLRPAGAIFAPLLRAASWQIPKLTVISNVDASIYQSVEQMQELLERQVSEPIEFAAGIKRLLSEGFTHFLEVGPGGSLGAMVKRISSQAVIYQATAADQIGRVAEQIQREIGGGLVE
ncbi:MAG TPA: [acyl-carrier-protein] S-malonyltransferase [Firmicutes bacterium]|nr:[acyl-carrier-protein] S-malonyltransferase [Bacillota bacterium]